MIEVRSEEGLRALCGYWQDQKESVYLLMPGAARTLHVYTLRPSGRLRYTQHLVRLITQNGLPRVVWERIVTRSCDVAQALSDGKGMARATSTTELLLLGRGWIVDSGVTSS